LAREDRERERERERERGLRREGRQWRLRGEEDRRERTREDRGGRETRAVKEGTLELGFALCANRAGAVRGNTTVGYDSGPMNSWCERTRKRRGTRKREREKGEGEGTAQRRDSRGG
jgi:hypothetical protein